MKRTTVLSTLLLFCCIAAPLQARVNLLRPYAPGMDVSISPSYDYILTPSIFIGEELLDIPVEVNYSFNDASELGILWGLKNFKNKTGIADIQVGYKYQLIKKSAEVVSRRNYANSHPAVISEAALSLPSADYKNQLGSGAVGLKLFWAIQQEVELIKFFLGIGAELNSENADKYRAGNVFSYKAGAAYDYDRNTEVIAEIKGFNHGQSKAAGILVKDAYQELYLAPGVNYRMNSQDISGSLLIGLTPGSHDIGIFASITF